MIKIHCETGETIIVEAETLSGAVLDGLNLHRALLQGSDLSGASFFATNLRSALLSDAVLVAANMREANLCLHSFP